MDYCHLPKYDARSKRYSQRRKNDMSICPATMSEGFRLLHDIQSVLGTGNPERSAVFDTRGLAYQPKPCLSAACYANIYSIIFVSIIIYTCYVFKVYKPADSLSKTYIDQYFLPVWPTLTWWGGLMANLLP